MKVTTLPGVAPLANMGRMSGEPKDQVFLEALNTESNSTGFSCQPLVTALTSSYNPAIMATWPGRDSVGTLVWETPQLPSVSILLRRKGAREVVVPGFSSKNLSARSPSPDDKKEYRRREDGVKKSEG